MTIQFEHGIKEYPPIDADVLDLETELVEDSQYATLEESPRSDVLLAGVAEKDRSHFGQTVVAAALNLVPTTPGTLTASDIDAHIGLGKNNMAIIKNGFINSFSSWRDKKGAQKITHPVKRGAAWVNLTFAESFAIAAQGVVQTEGGSTTSSFGVNMISALAIESGLSYLAAKDNNEKKPVEEIAEASATAFFLGGAMGVENKELPPSQMWAPVGAYMLWAAGLAVGGEINDSASMMLEHKVAVISGLTGWAVVKKMNEATGYASPLDRTADWCARWAKEHIKGKNSEETPAVNSEERVVLGS